MTRTITDVACTVCGCVCDDLAVTVDGGRIVRADGACRLAEPWFLSLNSSSPPAAEIDGSPADPATAYARAADILRAARSPLIFGLSRSTTEAQRAALELADRLGATIDTTASTGHGPSIVALQQAGESTCTLGEVRKRADLVVFWGCDPVTTHPRHIERYCPPRPGRTFIVADVCETVTARTADVFLRIEPGRDWEAFWTLRLLVAGKEPRPGSVTGAPLDALRDLAARMRDTPGIVFFGGGLVKQPHAHRAVEALLRLVTDLNEHVRFYARRLRRYGDVAGADSVLTWQTGYPFGVNLGRRYPRYNPGEFTAPEMLERGDVDACVLVGGAMAADLPPAALDHLRRIPVISLDPPGSERVVPAAVRFTTAVYGVHRPGTAYRMDEVAIPLRVLLPTDYPSDGEVLRELMARLNSLPAAR